MLLYEVVVLAMIDARYSTTAGLWRDAGAEQLQGTLVHIHHLCMLMGDRSFGLS